MIKVRGFILSDILSKGITAVFIPIFAYFMGPSDLASFGSWFLIFTIISLLINLGSPSYFSKRIIDNKSVDEELFLFFIFSLFLILFIAFVCFFLGIDVSPILCSYFFTFYQLRLTILRVNNELYLYIKNNILYSILCSVIPLLAYLYFNNWLARVYSYMIITFAFGGGALFLLLKLNVNYFSLKKLKAFSIEILKFGLPLSLSGAVFSFRTLFDFFSLQRSDFFELSASYFLSFQVVSVILLLGAILNRTLQPVVFKLIKDNGSYNDLLRSMSIKMILSLIPLLIFGWLFSILYSEYKGFYTFFFPMSISAIIYTIAQLYCSVFLYHSKSIVLLICSVLASCLHVFCTLTFVLIDKIELVGVSSLVSSTFFVMYIFKIKKKLKNVEV